MCPLCLPLDSPLHTLCLQWNHMQAYMCLYNLQVFSWGYNGSGSLGIRSTKTELSPKNVTSLQDQVVTKVSSYIISEEL